MVDGAHTILVSRIVPQAELEKIALDLSKVLAPGDLVLLYGPLGAGKTTFIRAVAEGLEVVDLVRSPSFTIANIYEGLVRVQHLDLYRLDEISDDDALALEEYVGEEAVTLVEWPEAGIDRLGSATWTVHLAHSSPDERVLELEAVTDDARRRWEEAHADG